MVHHYTGCGGCKHCRSGWAQMCLEGATVFGANGNGAHARYMKVRRARWFRCPTRSPSKRARRSPAAPARPTGRSSGSTCRAAKRSRSSARARSGLSATQLAVAMGARVIALDVSPERLALAREFGADEVIDARANNPVEAIRELTHGEGAHKTLDTSGAAEARAAAVRAARPGAPPAIVGERGQVTLDVSPDLLRRQITLVGSWTFSTQGQADCADFVADQHRGRQALHAPLAAGPGRGGLSLFDTQTTGKGVILPS